MAPILKAAVAAAGRFVLPWLFAAWVCWQLSILPLTWESWVPVAVAALIGYFLQKDAKPVLERFCRFSDAGPTPDKGGRSDIRLRGLGRLLEVYLIVVLAWTGGFLIATNLLRTHSSSVAQNGSDAEQVTLLAAVL